MKLKQNACLALLVGSILGSSNLWSQPTREELLYVDDARPVAQAIIELTNRYPVVITYEDPAYEYAGDAKDITDQVRNPNAENIDHRVLVPRGGYLEFRYDALESGEPADAADAIGKLVEANNINPAGARFDIRKSGDILHVIPAQVRDRDGRWVSQDLVLDTRITIPAQDLNGYEALNLITTNLSEASGVRVGLGSGGQFMGTLQRYTGRIEANNEPARDVLLRTLQAISERFTWLLFYAPDFKYYLLNLAVVAGAPTAPAPEFELVRPEEGSPTPTGRPFRLEDLEDSGQPDGLN